MNLSKDPTAESRKKDHIALAFRSVPDAHQLDQRFYYEPMLAGHPDNRSLAMDFMSHRLNAPIWVSSMTGGTEKAKTINKNLARACGEFGMGMGLGSCRQLLESSERLPDFDVRDLIGDFPLYANIGIAQVEQLSSTGELHRLDELVRMLRADGLIIHVNPLQEWYQPEGDRYMTAPIDLIQRCIDQSPDMSIIVKEVGQGFGLASMKALMRLSISAIEFAALGGTNFTQLEIDRKDALTDTDPMVLVGHSAAEMTQLFNRAHYELGDRALCTSVIISGGVRNYLDGYYLTEQCQGTAIYGQASGFLRHAMGDYDQLRVYVAEQIKGLNLAYQFLTIKDVHHG